jgi:hypothetical protein
VFYSVRNMRERHALLLLLQWKGSKIGCNCWGALQVQASRRCGCWIAWGKEIHRLVHIGPCLALHYGWQNAWCRKPDGHTVWRLASMISGMRTSDQLMYQKVLI